MSRSDPWSATDRSDLVVTGAAAEGEVGFVFFRAADHRLWVRRWPVDGDDLALEMPCTPARVGDQGPSAVAWDGGQVAVFFTDDDGCLAWRRWRAGALAKGSDDGISERLGGRPAGCPTAVRWGSDGGCLAVFYADPSGALVARWFEDGVWSGEDEVGTRGLEPHTGPAAVAYRDDRIAVFYLRREDPDDFPRLSWRRWSRRGGWGSEEEVAQAGHLTVTPAAVPWGIGGLALFYWRAGVPLERQGFFWAPWREGVGWLPERGPIGGVLGCTPAVLANEEHEVSVFYSGTSGALHWNGWRSGSGWVGETKLGGSLRSDPAVVVVRPGNGNGR